MACTACGLWYQSKVDKDSPAQFLCAACLPKVKSSEEQRLAAAAAAAAAVLVSPRRFPKKQDVVTHYDKAKKRQVKRYAVLQDQRLCLYKDEAAARRAKDPLEILDLTLLKKVTKLGYHMDKPYCLALTIEYDTTLLWVEMIEYGNWADALVDSGFNVVIGVLNE